MGDYNDAFMRNQNAAVRGATKGQNRANVLQLKLIGQSHPTGLTANLLKLFEPRPPLEYKPPPREEKVPSTHRIDILGSVKEVAMSTKKQQQSGPPQIVRLDKAFKLAEQWVNNMSKDVLDEPTAVEPEYHPSGLGLGAKVARQWRVGYPSDPVGRKLHAKLEAVKRKSAKSIGGNDNGDNHEESDEELESRTNAFAKKVKGPPPSSPSLQYIICIAAFNMQWRSNEKEERSFCKHSWTDVLIQGPLSIQRLLLFITQE
eukprot:XP_025012878.1 uncharacterized protein LOC8285018 isoform X3 [Ricinus communis]